MLTYSLGYTTESVNTPIVRVIPARPGWVARIVALSYEAGATEHTLTIMRPIGRTAVFKTAAGGDTDLELDVPFPAKDSSGDEDTLDASDWLIYLDSTGIYRADDTSLVVGNVMTLSNALAKSVIKGSPVWACYELARSSHAIVNAKANAVTTLRGLAIQGGITPELDPYNQRTGAGDPLVFYSPNDIDQGWLRHLCVEYVPHG